jgi:hypothetical protein
MSDTTTSNSHENKGSGADHRPDALGTIGAGEFETSRRHWEYDDDDDSSVIRSIN